MTYPKYIIAKTGYFGDLEQAIILSNGISHDEIGVPKHKIVSAGFFTWKTNSDSCGNPVIKSHPFGKSESLGVGSRESDSFLIDMALNWGGGL